MNIQIKWRLKNSNKPVNLDIAAYDNDCELFYEKVSVHDGLLYNFVLDTPVENKKYDLVISRFEQFDSDSTTHQSWAVIEYIQLDNFWKFTESNFPGRTIYEKNYYDTAKKNGATWEIEKDYHNNTLFFNGSIQIEISTPVRTMFWH